MSKFTDLFKHLGDLIESGLHKVADALHPLLKKVGDDLSASLPAIAVAALDAATAAANAPGDHSKAEAAYQAAKDAALGKAKELGIQEASALALSIRATAVNAAAEAVAGAGA